MEKNVIKFFFQSLKFHSIDIGFTYIGRIDNILYTLTSILVHKPLVRYRLDEYKQCLLSTQRLNILLLESQPQ